MSVNVKGLCKLIRQDSRKSMVWTVENGVHYITNRNWAVRFSELPREVLISMFSIFAKLPEEGRSLVITRFGEDERPCMSLEATFRECEAYTSKGEITNIIIDRGKFSARVIKTKEHIIRVNNNYLSILNDGCDSILCGGKFQPVSLGDNQMLILPIKVENAKEEDDMINELLAG